MDAIKNFLHKLLYGITIVCIPAGLESVGMYFFHDTASAWLLAFAGSIAIAWSVITSRKERAERQADEIITSFEKHEAGLHGRADFINDIRRSVNDDTL